MFLGAIDNCGKNLEIHCQSLFVLVCKMTYAIALAVWVQCLTSSELIWLMCIPVGRKQSIGRLKPLIDHMVSKICEKYDFPYHLNESRDSSTF